ncbi:MAG TPA: ATP-binding protein [Thermoanaerobaculia bacterium]|nr:ATP-binding protein [Thermoanaerobaculia bacterium]
MQIGADVLYKALFDTTPDGIMIVDAAGTYVDLNPSMCRMLHGTREQLVGRHFRDFIPPDRLDDAIAAFGQLRSDGALAVEFPVRALDGSVLHLEWRSRADFVPGLHFCVARDVSALRESEERYRAFMANTSEAIWRFELEEPVPILLPPDEQIELFYRHGYLAECNDAMAAMYGFASRDELTGARLGDLLVRDDPDNIAYLCAFIESGYRLTDAESTERDREGNTKYFANNLLGIIDGGALVRAWGTQRDVTDSRRSDREKAVLLATASFLAQASEVLSSSLDYDQTLAAIAAVAVPQFYDWCFVDEVDAHGVVRRLVIRHSDERQIALAKESEEKFPTLGDPSYGPPRVIKTGRAEMAVEIDDAMLVRLARSEEHLDILRRMGFCSAAIVPLVARGRTLGALTFANSESGRHFDEAALRTAEDLARRAAMAADNARLYQQLESANRGKDDFLATLSHELRTPMTATLGWASMLRMGGLSDDTLRTAVETIAQSTAAQAKLIDDILDVSRIVTGKMQISLQPVRLADPIGAALETVRSAADAKQLAVDLELAAEEARVSGDPARLQQVLWNLLSNAVKFTPRGGRVRVVLDRPETGSARITVSDDGEGIAPDFLPFVFERFRQGETGMNRRHSGLGLGLSIARNLVELHGGRMTAHSDGVGQGATFTVFLPLLPPAREGEPIGAGRSTPALLRDLRVLVVEDEDATRTMLGVALRQFGADAVAVASAEEAMRALTAGEFDVVVSDIGLPGEDGYSLIRRIRESEGRMRGVGAIALTAYAAGGDRDRALAAGFQSYLSKPIDPAVLAAEVQRIGRQ